MADHIGLRAGIPLVSGAGDKVASCIGAGVVETSDANFEASSYGAIHVCADDFRSDEAYDCLSSPIPGAYYLTKYIAGSGITLDWFVNNFVRKEDESLESAFARVERDILDVPAGCGGLMGIGMLAGNAFPLDGTTRGMWMGFDWSHKPAHFYRAFLESYAYEFSATFDQIKANYPELDIKSVYTLGGGAKSTGWMQLSADVSRLKHLTFSRNDASAWGVSILAGNAIGVIPDIKEKAKSTAGVTHTYIPAEDTYAVYQRYKALYWKFLSDMKNSYKQLDEIKS